MTAKKRPKPKKPRLTLAHLMAALAVMHEKFDNVNLALAHLDKLRSKQDEQIDRMIVCHRLMLRRIERFGQRVTEQSIRREIRTPTLKVAG